MIRALAAAVLVLAGVAFADEAPRPLEGGAREAFLGRIEKSMSSVRSFAAAFDQEKTNTLFAEPSVSRGVIFFAQPNRLRWEIQEPFQSILVVADNQAAKFEIDEGKRTALKLGKGGDVVVTIMSRIESWFRGDFQAKEYDADVYEKPAARIVMRPRDAGMAKNLQAIELDFAPTLDSIERVTILEKAGDRTVMRFKVLKRGIELPEGTFSISDPLPVEQVKLD